jgi:hypothetical protein
MTMNDYLHLRVREMELETIDRKPDALRDTPPRRRRSVTAPAARAIGSRLRRLGEAIERWAFFSERQNAMRADARRL